MRTDAHRPEDGAGGKDRSSRRRWMAAGAAGGVLAGMSAAAVTVALPATATVPTAATAMAHDLTAATAGGLATPGGATSGTAGTPSATSGTAGSAPASGALHCTSPSVFAAAQHQLQTDLSQRVARLSALAARVSRAKHLPAADATTLSGIISAEQSSLDNGGIAGLQAAVATETTCSQLRATAKQMVQDFRVYVVVAPQVGITVCSTGSLAAATRATSLEPVIEARIARAQQHGKNVAGAQQAFADLKMQLSTASQTLSGIDVAQVLAQVPSDFPGDRSMLQGDFATMRQADSALKAARADLKTIRQDLRGTAGAGASPGSVVPGTGSTGVSA